jgi:hypothetical protein
MKITLADKFIAWLTLICGLSLSAVAIYYSVAGLVSIFAAAVVPIIIMGAVLEISKLVATVWLKQNWFVAPRAIKAYLLAAIALLMFITSMGIFGYLSKAHTDQSLVSGDVQSKIALYDEKIKTERENIDASRRALKQMDEAVDQTMSRTDSERGAERAVQIRRQQQAERARLQKDIATAQSNISKLTEERSPIAAEVRKVEAEVGPIKYIAKLIYGDNPDANLLEKAVTWVIIMIVVVFDPLAVIMLLASQYSFQWFKKQEEEHPPYYVADVGEKPTPDELEDDGVREPCPKCGTSMLDAPGIGVYCPNKECDVFDGPKSYLAEQEDKDAVWPFPTYDEITPKENLTTHHPDTHPYLREGFKYPPGWMFQPPLVGKIEEPTQEELKPITNEEIDAQLDKDLNDDIELSDEEKEARRRWKENHPDSTIKQQEYLKDVGRIDKLPWEDESKKKSKYIVKEDNHQVKKTKD